MGNGFTKLTHCFSPSRPRPRPRRRIDSAAVTSEPLDEGLGHSFCYATTSSAFYSISGAAVSANTSTALSTSLPYDSLPSSAFDSSTSFSSYPLYPVPRFSGPIDRGFLSGPLDPRSSSSAAALFSGPIRTNKHSGSAQLRRSFSHGGRLIRNLSKAIGRTVSVPVKVFSKQDSLNSNSPASASSSGSVEISDEADNNINNDCQWAQGKAGEDRVHVVVSEERGWLFVGIYDGFNGPDATDYLLSNLYTAIRRELEGLLWVEKGEGERCGEGGGGEKRVRWKCDWEREGLERPNHSEVLKAMNEGLRRTEEGFLGIADEVFVENPELALMGSCVLVAMMKGEDLYVMNIGDSRAVLGHKDLERLGDERLNDFGLDFSPTLSALQLTLDHSTCVEEV